MKSDPIKYTFKEFPNDYPAFSGVSRETLAATMKYLEDGILRTSRVKARKFLVFTSFRTKLGVIDCFVN